MLGGTITLFLWSVFAFIISIVLLVFMIRFMRSARKYNAEAEEMVKVVEVRLKRQHNRIATMAPRDLEDYLIGIFAQSLELASYQTVSKVDPDGEITLYATAMPIMIKKLGSETIEALDYYYGANYISRWSLMAYEMLEKRGVINTVIHAKSEKTAVQVIRALGN